MISYLKGQIEEKTDNLISIDVNGVGYSVLVPTCDINSLEEGQNVKIYTYLNVRQDAMELYGSVSKQVISIFKKLIEVSGIGPKVAIGILSKMPAYDLVNAIVTSDITMLSTCPGIGKKTAGRMILELKDKLLTVDVDKSSASSKTVTNKGNEVYNEAIEAMINLGYKKPEAKSIVDKVYTVDMTLENVILAALKG